MARVIRATAPRCAAAVTANAAQKTARSAAFAAKGGDVLTGVLESERQRQRRPDIRHIIIENVAV